MGFLKFKCVDDTETVTTKGGFFSKDITNMEKVDGITKGKIYLGVLIETPTQFGAFLLYDDNGEWVLYDDYHLAPAEDA